MNETRDARFNELLCQAVELPDDAHEAFLESVCDDSELRREVLEAIRGHDDLGDFLEQPVVADLAGTAEADDFADAGDSTVVGRPRRSVGSTPRGAVRVEPGPEPDAIARIGLPTLFGGVGVPNCWEWRLHDDFLHENKVFRLGLDEATLNRIVNRLCKPEIARLASRKCE